MKINIPTPGLPPVPLDLPDASDVKKLLGKDQPADGQEVERPEREDRGASLKGEQFLGGVAQQIALKSFQDPEHKVPDRAEIPSQPRGPAAASDVFINGSRGPEVKNFQNRLNEWRLEHGRPPIQADGAYGPQTEAAVKDFQEAMGLTADGKAGNNTKARLAMEENAEFKQLDPDVQDSARDEFNGFQNNPAARDNLSSTVTDPEFLNASREEQFAQLNRLKPHDPNLEV